MKNWKSTLLALVCTLLCGMAQAQYRGSYRMNPRNPYGGAYPGRFKQRPEHARFRRGFDVDSWNQLNFQLRFDNMKLDHVNFKNAKLTTISLGINHGTRIASLAPIYLEGGAALEYTWDNTQYLRNFKNFALVVPLDIDFVIPVGYVALIPYTGFYMRLNLAGEEHDKSLYNDESTYGEWNRFQAGWQIGSKLRFSPNFHIGIAYARDLSAWHEGLGAKRGALIVSTGVGF